MMSGSLSILVRYILDPKEVHGEDFPGETFRVLKEKEIKQFRQEQYFKVAESKRDCLD